jgi:hypothetical protein
LDVTVITCIWRCITDWGCRHNFHLIENSV